MNRTVQFLAEQIGATPKGDEHFVPAALVALETADSVSLCPLFHKRSLAAAPALPGAVLADRRTAAAALDAGVRAALVHDKPQLALAALIDLFFPARPRFGAIHPTAYVHPEAHIDPTADIGPCAVVEADVEIGADTVIGPSAVIREGSRIGARVQIGPGAVIGHEGFGFLPDGTGLRKVRQVGRTVIEDDVEIGAQSCVDRGTLGTTRICAGAKIDNLVQIGHNAHIGRFAVLAGQVGIAGSAIIEDGAMLGGQAGVADHLTVGRGAKVAAKSGVIANIPPETVVAGYPAMPRMRWLRFFAAAREDAPFRPRKRPRSGR